MGLLRKTLIWSLSIWLLWSFLVCSLFFFPLTNSIIDQVRGVVLAAMLLLGMVVVVPSLIGISVTGLMNHNIDMGLVIIASFLVNTGLLYLFFLIKAKLKIHKSRKQALN